jgi:extracellular factor (EF) 3-hydroxypalmitic acid methyl ester biosynthesis protein
MRTKSLDDHYSTVTQYDLATDRKSIANGQDGSVRNTAAKQLVPQLDMSELLAFWPESLRALTSGNSTDGMRRVGDGLKAIRDALPPTEWRVFAQSPALDQLRALLHEDPFTERAFRKPRGYAGDAVILDMIYGSTALPEETSALGVSINEGTTHGPSSRSVRSRRNFLADYIDRAASDYRRPAILSVACGHLREAQRCAAVASGRIGRLVALDQDARSLGVVAAEQAHFGVEPLETSVRALIAGRAPLGQFDVIYAAGLYDYLEQPVAAALTRRLLSAVNTGGKLLIANFTPDLIDIAYMESIMDWWLIYRDDEAMMALTLGLAEDEIARAQTWRDELNNIVYLELTRGKGPAEATSRT